MAANSNTPQPRRRVTLSEEGRSALTTALYHADIIAAAHYTDTVPHYLVKPGRGQDFRNTLYLHGCRCGESYHRDGDASGFSDWRKVEVI